jgi:hypothetical protein
LCAIANALHEKTPFDTYVTLFLDYYPNPALWIFSRDWLDFMLLENDAKWLLQQNSDTPIITVANWKPLIEFVLQNNITGEQLYTSPISDY